MDYSPIHKILQDAIGLRVDTVGDIFFNRIVKSRMEHYKVQNIYDYIDIVNSLPDELDELIENVIIPETWFFRDSEPFVYLKEYIQHKWLPKNYSKVLRVLSCPCSTGEEPYSIAITLIEAGMLPKQFRVDAVDISRIGLEKAKKAVYRKESFRGKDKEYIQSFFPHHGQEYHLERCMKESVHFFKGNLLDLNTFAGLEPYHILFFRNLLIYLTDDAKKKILTHLNRLLVEDGLLFTGHTELYYFRQCGYEIVKHPKSFACRKSGSGKNKPKKHQPGKIKKKSVSVRSAVSKITTVKQNLKSDEKNQGGKYSKLKLEEVRNLADSGALRKAFSLCEEYISKNRVDAEVYFLMGLICQAEDSIYSAEDYYLKSVYLNPGNYEALVHLSLLYEQMGDIEKGSHYKERAERQHRIKKNPEPIKNTVQSEK